MICLKCESEEFVPNPDAVVEQEFRGETFNVVSPVMECKHCGWRVLAKGQMDELGRRTSDAYRKRHNLLTSEEIKELKELSGGHYAAILVMIFNARIIVTDGVNIDRAFCYTNVEKAKKYFDLWDGTGEPLGWHKNPFTGKYLKEEHEKQI